MTTPAEYLHPDELSLMPEIDAYIKSHTPQEGLPKAIPLVNRPMAPLPKLMVPSVATDKAQPVRMPPVQVVPREDTPTDDLDSFF